MTTSASSTVSPSGTNGLIGFSACGRRADRARIAERLPVGVAPELIGQAVVEEQREVDQALDPGGGLGAHEADVAHDLLARALGELGEALGVERIEQQAEAGHLLGRRRGEQLQCRVGHAEVACLTGKEAAGIGLAGD